MPLLFDIVDHCSVLVPKFYLGNGHMIVGIYMRLAFGAADFACSSAMVALCWADV